MEIWASAPGIYFRPSILFLSRVFCITPSPMFLWEVLIGRALDEKLVCLLPTQIWPGAGSELRGATPGMHPDPQRPTGISMTMEVQRRERKEGRRAGDPTGQHYFSTHMSYFPFLPQHEIKCLLPPLRSTKCSPTPSQSQGTLLEEGISLPSHEVTGTFTVLQCALCRQPETGLRF